MSSTPSSIDDFKYFLIFLHYESAPESHSVYNCELVISKTPTEVIEYGKKLYHVKYTESERDNLPHTCNDEGTNICDACDAEALGIMEIFPSKDLVKMEFQKKLENQKLYYEKLMEQKLAEQKEQLLKEIYAPPDTIGSNNSYYNGLRSIGYGAAKERFES
jgi:hypothetical protein